ncbi:MAG: MaoC family dehydratase [Hasllibacter sp.]
MTKTNPGNFFEDFRLGQVIAHRFPRTLGTGERALYQALYPVMHPLQTSEAVARLCGLPGAPLDEWMVFHAAFGKTVPEISLNAVANLGYAEGRWLAPMWPGDALRVTSEVIGLKQTSSGRTGIVWVRTKASNQRGEDVLEYVRWVLVNKRDPDAPAPETTVPDLKPALDVADLTVPPDMALAPFVEAGIAGPHRLGDYAAGEVIDHVDGITVEEAEHMMATRLWQNTAKVHFDQTRREDGRRLVYGGHVISLARALSFNGLENALLTVGLNGGTHANPCFAGDTVRAWSEVLDVRPTRTEGIGAIRLRTVATKGGAPGELKDDRGRHRPHVLLDLDSWVLMPS